MSRIDEVRARWALIPAGPWEASYGAVRCAKGDVAICHDTNHIGDGEQAAEAIAAAPVDVAYLLAIADAAVAHLRAWDRMEDAAPSRTALRAALARGPA